MVLSKFSTLVNRDQQQNRGCCGVVVGGAGRCYKCHHFVHHHRVLVNHRCTLFPGDAQARVPRIVNHIINMRPGELCVYKQVRMCTFMPVPRGKVHICLCFMRVYVRRLSGCELCRVVDLVHLCLETCLSAW